MSLSATLFGRDSAIFKATNILGLGIPGWLDKKFGAKDLNIEGPRLSDLSVQTSTYGAPIPRLYGTIAVMGNLIWLENNKLKETVRKNKSSSGGKGGGGGSSEPTTTYSYSATFHIALCEGPIAGIRRMWCGDKLLYNAGSDDLETIIASNKAAKGWRLYLGTDSQLPDSRYEANVGVGNASAHRGMAYLAFYDFKLADYSNTLQGAQFKVEVVAVDLTQVNILVDETPFSESTFSSRSGAAFYDDLIGFRYLDDRTVSSAVVRDFRLGKSSATKVSITAIDVNPPEEMSGVVSYGNESWAFYDSNDLANPTKILSDKGRKFKLSGVGSVKCIRQTDITDVFVVMYSGTPSNRYVLGRVGRVSLPAGGEEATIGFSIGATSGFRISSSGDSVHEYRIFGSSLSVKVYDDNLSLINEYTISINSAEWSAVITPDSYFPGASDSASYYKNEVLYLVRQFGDGLYRVASFNSSGQLDGYTFSASPSAQGIFGFIIYDENQGILVNETAIQWRRYVDGADSLSSVIDQEINNSGLLRSIDVNTSALEQSLRGYRVIGGSIRSAIEPLQIAFPFDVRSHGYEIQFLPRGQGVSVTIPSDDLVSSEGSSEDSIFNRSREMDPQLPAKTVIKYLEAAREYAIGEQYSERLNTEAVNKVEIDLPIVLNAGESAGIAEMMNFIPWLERTPASFSLPPVYRTIEPGDVCVVSFQDATYEIRLTSVNESQDGILECSAVPSRAALYTPSAAGSEGVAPTGTIPLAGESLFIALDIPVIDETLQDSPGFVGAMLGDSSNWPGGILVRSADGGQTWVDIQAYTSPVTVGIARGVLPAGASPQVSYHLLTVDMLSGELESVTRDQMLAGINYAAYGVDGRWEILRFHSALLQSDASFLLSGFARGEKGTEWATSLHEPGDYFVLLDDPDGAFIGLAVDSILNPRLYRAITSGGSLDDADDVPFTYKGVNLECLSPIYPQGLRDSSGNFSGTFTRRSRLSSSWWTTGVAAPVGEASESYEIEVMSGATVKRVISLTSPSFTYSVANQIIDFGSAQAAITFRIYQLSAIVGRGYPLEVTL